MNYRCSIILSLIALSAVYALRVKLCDESPIEEKPKIDDEKILTYIFKKKLIRNDV